MPWAKISSDRIWRKYTWLSVIASKGRCKGKYDLVTEKYTANPYRTYTINKQGPEWNLHERDPHPAPFSIPFDAAWIFQDTQTAVNPSTLLQDQTFTDMDSRHEET
jgi:hypothetical protein